MIAVGLCWLGLSGHAAAFTHGEDFGAYPSTKLGAGGGRYFTGSPADGFDCSVCHTSPSGYHPPLYQKGLPVEGYIPGKFYSEITLTWPEVTGLEASAAAQGLHPATALMIEFVSEDGGNAGTLEFQTAVLRKEGFCAPTVGATDAPSFAGTIYSAAKSKLPLAITPDMADADREKGACQTGGEDERRCLLWVSPCGAKSIRFSWTAPPKLRGPVWFSAGLVHTFDATSKPNDNDFASLLSIPMNAAPDGSTYESRLESGCSIVAAGRAGRSSRRSSTSGAVVIMLSVIGFLVRRRHGARALLGLASVAMVGNAACSDPAPITVMRESSAIGRFEPVACPKCEEDRPRRCRIGNDEDFKKCWAKANAGSAAPSVPGAGTPSALAASMLAPAAGAAAPAAGAGMAINGSLQIAFTTAQLPGVVSDEINKCLMKPNDGCAAPNYTAVWIEDATGKYVKSLEYTNGPYPLSLKRYVTLGEDCVCEADIVSMPSTTNVHRIHMPVWKGRDAAGNPAPLGPYQLQIELAIGNNQAWRQTIPFEISAAPIPGTWPKIIPAPVPANVHTGVTLNFIPNP